MGSVTPSEGAQAVFHKLPSGPDKRLVEIGEGTISSCWRRIGSSFSTRCNSSSIGRARQTDSSSPSWRSSVAISITTVARVVGGAGYLAMRLKEAALTGAESPVWVQPCLPPWGRTSASAECRPWSGRAVRWSSGAILLARFSRLTNGCALECGVGFRQLRTCRRTGPGQLCAENCLFQLVNIHLAQHLCRQKLTLCEAVEDLRPAQALSPPTFIDAARRQPILRSAHK